MSDPRIKTGTGSQHFLVIDPTQQDQLCVAVREGYNEQVGCFDWFDGHTSTVAPHNLRDLAYHQTEAAYEIHGTTIASTEMAFPDYGYEAGATCVTTLGKCQIAKGVTGEEDYEVLDRPEILEVRSNGELKRVITARDSQLTDRWLWDFPNRIVRVSQATKKEGGLWNLSVSLIFAPQHGSAIVYGVSAQSTCLDAMPTLGFLNSDPMRQDFKLHLPFPKRLSLFSGGTHPVFHVLQCNNNLGTPTEITTSRGIDADGLVVRVHTNDPDFNPRIIHAGGILSKTHNLQWIPPTAEEWLIENF